MTAPLFQFGQSHPDSMPTAPPADAAEVKRCTVPAFAKAIGHEDKWKLHNNCK